MAKYTPTPSFEVYKGTHHQPRLTDIDRGGLDLTLSRNQHALLIHRVPRGTVRRTEAQALLRDRFAQLECMWQAMTWRQRKLMGEYARELNARDGANLIPIQRFRSLGLRSQLYRFILAKLNPYYTLELIHQDETSRTYKATLETKAVTEFWLSPWRRIF